MKKIRLFFENHSVILFKNILSTLMICGLGSFSHAQSFLNTIINGEVDYESTGSSVSISKDSQTVAIGAAYAYGGGTRRGLVRVFYWNSDSNNWVKRGSDINGTENDGLFGYSVSMSDDGKTLAIGAQYNSGGGTERGVVRILTWNMGTGSWVQLGSDINGENNYDWSGSSVSLSSDGRTIAIGAVLNAGNGGSRRGHTRIYRWNSTTSSWEQLGSDLDGAGDNDRFGYSVSLSGNGQTVAIGAPFNAGGGSNRGHVRIYYWNSVNWVQKGSDVLGVDNSENLGRSVSLSTDGQIVAIGSPFSNGGGTYRGKVRTYLWNNDSSNWIQLGSDINGKGNFDYSGSSVSLSGDGKTLAIGAYNSSIYGSSRGHTRIFRWNSDSSKWLQRGDDIYGKVANNEYNGFSVSLNNNGQTAAISALNHPGGGIYRGQVGIYELSCLIPSVNSEPSDRSVCPGGNALFGYEATGDIDSFRWESNTGSGWMAVAGSNNDTLTITNATVATQYRGIAFAACGNDTTRTAQLSIHSLPATSLTSSRNPSTNGYAPYQCTNLKANATGNGMLSISWAHGPATDSVQVCPTAGQKYYVTVTDGNGCVKTDSIRQYVVNAATPYAGYSAICYRYPRRNIYYTLSVRETQVPYYLGLGATLGACGSTPSKRGEEATFAGIADLYNYYPNPASNTLHVEWFNLFAEEVSIDVLDMTGKVVKTLYNGSVVEGELSNLQADMTDLNNGMYLLRFSSNSDYRINKIQLIR